VSTPLPITAPKLLAYDQVAANRRRVRILLTVFGLMLLPFAFWLAHYVAAWLTILVLPSILGWERVVGNPPLTISVAAFLAIQITVLVAYLVYRDSARRVLQVAGARSLRPGEATALRRVVENLCIGSGLPEPAVAIVDAPGINAFATGLEPATSTLVVTRGAIEALDRRELEGLVAHELVQIAGHDVCLGTVVAGLVRFMWLPLSVLVGVVPRIEALLRAVGVGPAATRVCLVALGVWVGLPVVWMIIAAFSLALAMFAENPRSGAVFLTLLALPFYVAVVTPIAGLLMLRTISREHVSRADADALLLTRNPGGLARALATLSVGENAAVATPRATTPLWVADPTGESTGGWATLLATHPPLTNRIETIARMGDVTEAELDAARQAGALVRRKEAKA